MTVTTDLRSTVRNALTIPAYTHAEAGRLAQVEYERVTAVLEQLSGADWQQPTYCTEWNVRDMVAHLAGAATGSTSFAEFRRQNVSHPYVKKYGGIDGTNKLQLEERAGNDPAALVAEFRKNGQIAVNNRQKLPWLVRKIHIPMGTLGFSSFEYLMDVIYPRDQWMHRYDICAATGMEMVVTDEHDGRIFELIVVDIARKLRAQSATHTVALQLTGAHQAEYCFGDKATPDCTVTIDFFTFNLRASGRIGDAEAMEQATVTGDRTVAAWFLQHCDVPY